MSRSGAPPQAEVTKSLWSTVPASTKRDDPGPERGREAAHGLDPIRLEPGADRVVALLRGGRVGADEEGVSPRSLDPAHELVALAVERVEQNEPAHAALVAADVSE